MQNEQRAEGIQRAFIFSYAQLQSICYQEWPGLSAFGCEQILTSLASNLHRYKRPPDGRFMLWAVAWVRRETQRHRFLTQLFSSSHRLVYSAVARSLFCADAEDAATEPCDSEADVYLHLLKKPRKIDGLMRPQKAKSTTLLYGLTESRLRAYRKRIRTRRAAVERRLSEGCELLCETASTDEEKSEALSVA